MGIKSISKALLRIIVFLLFILFFLSFNNKIFAHPGNTDSSGCHTCRTNCSSWGLYYGEYHCHEPKDYSPPEIYTPPPSCPLFSYYDSLSDSCKCYSGYVASGDKCISQNEWCQNQFGFNSRYDILSDSCECSYGYVFEDNKCVSGELHCSNRYGYNSSYDSLSESCKCRYGYVFNKSGNRCISEDDWCQEEFGYGSEYDSLEDNCVCSSGYKFDGDECVIDVPVYKPAPRIIQSLPTTIPTSRPIPQKKQIVPTTATTAASEPTQQYTYPYHLQTELKLDDRGEEVKILQSALATDKGLYPEGLVSGFFGQATERAVKRFQKQHGLGEKGLVDKDTIVKFNMVFGDKTVLPTVPSPTNEGKSKGNPVLNFISNLWRILSPW